jgi:hypothetical protein
MKKTSAVAKAQDTMGIIVNCEINITFLVRYSFDPDQWAFEFWCLLCKRLNA